MNLDYKTVYSILTFLLECQNDMSRLDNENLSGTVKLAFKDYFQKANASMEGGVKLTELTDVDIEKETVRLYESIRKMELQSNLDEKERMNLYKMQAALTKDLLDMMKDAKEIKKIREFEEIVFTILTDEQKQQVLKIFE